MNVRYIHFYIHSCHEPKVTRPPATCLGLVQTGRLDAGADTGGGGAGDPGPQNFWAT